MLEKYIAELKDESSITSDEKIIENEQKEFYKYNVEGNSNG